MPPFDSARPSDAAPPTGASGGTFVFGPFRLDPSAAQLFCRHEPVVLSPKQFVVLRELVLAAGRIVSKDHLIKVAWQGRAMGDSSLEKLIAHIRQRLAEADASPFIETVARRGYRFVAAVTRQETGPSEADLDAMMGPHRALIEGRTLLESPHRLHLDDVVALFTDLVTRYPWNARCHVGLANACWWQFESTRASAAPNLPALERAVAHATEARRLAPLLAEAWATFGVVIDRAGDRTRGLAALEHAAELEPGNWQHPLRLANAGWGNLRLNAAQRALELFPGLPYAHALAATVYVARNAMSPAEREIDLGVGGAVSSPASGGRSTIALNWMKGLVCYRRGQSDDAISWYRRELALEAKGDVYAPECCASVSYALGVCHMDHHEPDAARAAVAETLRRVPWHPQAHAVLAILEGRVTPAASEALVRIATRPGMPMPFELVMAQAALLRFAGDVPAAAQLVDAALATAPPGNAGWLLPLDPLLAVHRAPEPWSSPLTRLGNRAGWTGGA